MELKSINDMTMPELALVISTKLLGICKHSRDFVELQKKSLDGVSMSKVAKQMCLDALDAIEVDEEKKA